MVICLNLNCFCISSSCPNALEPMMNVARNNKTKAIKCSLWKRLFCITIEEITFKNDNIMRYDLLKIPLFSKVKGKNH
jgi:hypothetical protein